MARIPIVTLSKYLLQGLLTHRGCLNKLTSPRPSVRPLALANRSRLPCCGRFTFFSSLGSSPLSPASSSHSAPPFVVARTQHKKERSKRLRAQDGEHWSNRQFVPGWELTVGIEIHAQLNSAGKLFSPAPAPPALSPTAPSIPPNTHVALFDLAVPGSQPLLQEPALIPAVRAALALGCEVREESAFDRKHYFWWDQPAGYQLTQYYRPFAVGGEVCLFPRDGIAAEDADKNGVRVGIRQVQLEQDTAKTLATTSPGGEGRMLVDFNRAGVPLIEIITEPVIRHPATAAALVRKIQALLHSVDACVSGMESGGLRADINVSVRRVPTSPMDKVNENSSSGNRNKNNNNNNNNNSSNNNNNNNNTAPELGTRTEIKNLSTFKSIEDAVIAERNRQIRLIEAGDVVASETRGWTLGGRETRRLRGKEGQVDYRYMPDADVPPLRIGRDLIEHLRASLPVGPDAEVDELVETCGLTEKDALSLVALDEGRRIEYFYKVISAVSREASEFRAFATLVGNWVLHEFGRLTSEKAKRATASGEEEEVVVLTDDGLSGQRLLPPFAFSADGECDRISVAALQVLLLHLHQRRITGSVAKKLLIRLFDGEIIAKADGTGLMAVIDEEDLWYHGLERKAYEHLAARVAEENIKVVQELVKTMTMKAANENMRPEEVTSKEARPSDVLGLGKTRGKVQFLVGKMMRLGPRGQMDAKVAEEVVKEWLYKQK